MTTWQVRLAKNSKKEMSNIGSVCWYGVPGATDIWQPVDAGYAEQLKTLVKQVHYKWLNNDENAEKWHRTDIKFTASERRILISHWVGKAYASLTDKRFDDYQRRLFDKTGCLLTTDGSEDGSQKVCLTIKCLPRPLLNRLQLIQYNPTQTLKYTLMGKKKKKLLLMTKMNSMI